MRFPRPIREPDREDRGADRPRAPEPVDYDRASRFRSGHGPPHGPVNISWPAFTASKTAAASIRGEVLPSRIRGTASRIFLAVRHQTKVPEPRGLVNRSAILTLPNASGPT